MRNLIIKDLILQKKYFLYTLGYGIFMFLVFNNQLFNDFIYSMGSIAMSYVSIMYLITFDSRYKTDTVLNSLPIKRRDVIMAKYLTFLAIIALSLLIMSIIGGVFNIIGLIRVRRYISFYDVIMTFVSIVILSSIYYPLNLRFGGYFVRIFTTFLFIGALFLPKVSAEFLDENMYNPKFESVFKILINTNGQVLIFGALMFIVILMFVSYKISLKIYSNKEFS